MSFTVGMPVMKLNRSKGQSGKHTGNAWAVILEALEERYCNDIDLDRSKTKDNIYLTNFTSGKALCSYWEQRAENFTVTTKKGQQKKLRSDANIGFAGICKPALDSDFGSYTKQQQIQFCKDSFEVLQTVYAKYGITLDFGVIHLDEGNAHLHYGGHDEDFKLGSRLKLNLFNDLNKGDYPRMMRERGWDIKNLGGYDVEKASKMDADELKAYKEECIEYKRSRKNGRSSKQYKADKEAERTVREAEQVKRQAEQMKQQAEKQQQDIQRQQKANKARKDDLDRREDNIAEKEKAVFMKPTDDYRSLFGYTLTKTDELQQKDEKIAILQKTADNKITLDNAVSEAEADRRAAAEERKQAEEAHKRAERLKKNEEQIIKNEVKKRLEERTEQIKRNYEADISRKDNEIQRLKAFLKKEDKLQQYIDEQNAKRKKINVAGISVNSNDFQYE